MAEAHSPMNWVSLAPIQQLSLKMLLNLLQ
jgi:hypothetical protein